jgi:hypothetical protein
VELVGNRYALARRQRLAVARCACSDQALQLRRSHQVDPPALRDRELWLDGYNVVIALEAAMSGGVILRGRDGCCRDLANIYARYREVEETLPALRLVGELTATWGARRCCWLLDRPVSNSGRFRKTILDVAAGAGWNWAVELDFNPDKTLAQSKEIIATSDSVILDRSEYWINLVALVIAQRLPQPRVVDFSLNVT